jgi:hypothetical protein
VVEEDHRRLRMTTIYRRMDPGERGLLIALSLGIVALLLGPFPPAMNNALGVIVGVLAGYLTSSHCSRKASAEVQEVVYKVRLVLRGLEEEPRESVRDPITGEPVGHKRKVRMTSEAKASMSARGKVVRHEDDTPTE